mmetsp:Transcript_4337/g.3164  ORF Transcript_4337/g.3164 Transcript_4337/m.3164 type:complete len:123 (+) Transcript_4337:311-679(+)
MSLPFWSDTELGIFEAIQSQEVVYHPHRNISAGLKQVISLMLDKNPKSRITMEELKRLSWLNDGFAVKLYQKEADYIANFTEEEFQAKGIPLHAIVIAKKIAKKWTSKGVGKKKKNSDNSLS